MPIPPQRARLKQLYPTAIRTVRRIVRLPEWLGARGINDDGVVGIAGGGASGTVDGEGGPGKVEAGFGAGDGGRVVCR